MLKFVSRKPPKGKMGAEEIITSRPFQQTRPAFRPRAYSNQRSPQSFEPYTRGDKSYIHRSPKLGGRETTPTKYADVPGEEDPEGIYDNLSKMREKIHEMYENGQDRSIDSEFIRSRSPSNISTESSSHGSFRPKNYHGIFHDPRRSGSYRHVTWSPDVTNGDKLPTLENRSLSFSGHHERVLPEATDVGHVTSNGRSHSFSGRRQNISDLETDSPHGGSLYSKLQKAKSDYTPPTSEYSRDTMATRTVNVAQKFRGDDIGQTTNLHHLGSIPTPHSSDHSHNLSDSHISFPASYPQSSDSAIFGSSPTLANRQVEPNYAYYTTLPANFSMRSNFVFSPRTCSTPVKDFFPHLDQTSKKTTQLPRDQMQGQYPDQSFPGHMTKILPYKEKVRGSKEGEDEYDNIITAEEELYKKQVNKSRDEDLKQAYKVTDEMVAKETRPSHSRGFPHLCDSEQRSVTDTHHLRESTPDSQMADDNPLRKVRRGFPRLFLSREKKKKNITQNSPKISDHVTSSTSGPGPGQSPVQGSVSLGGSMMSPPRVVDNSLVIKHQPKQENLLLTNIQRYPHDNLPQGHQWKQVQGQRDEYQSQGYSFQPVMTSCVPQVNHEVRHESVNRYQFSPREPPVSGSSTPGAKMTTMRDMLNRSQDQVEDDQLVLDLVYITERIISMSFPSDGHEATYRYNLKEVMTMLRTKHGDNCLVLNLSDTRPDLEKLSPKHVMDYGWPDFLAPPLERLCNICKAMDSWLNSDPNHVVVIHCKGSNSRIALIIAAFMNYSSICASADQALDRFAMKRFYDDKLGGITHPSQQRYVEYFYGLLSGAIKINSNPLYLHHIVIHGVPNFDTKGGCRPFIKVFQGMQPIFTSGVYNVTDQMQKVCISISPGIPLRGDIMIRCFHKKSKATAQESVWSCQFHTCAVSGFTLVFAKKDLDDARIDPRFPESGKVEFVFGSSQDSQVKVSDFKSDVTVPVDDNDNIDQWDSFQNYTNANRENRTVDGIVGNTSTSMSSSMNISPQYSAGVHSEPTQRSYSSTINSTKSGYTSTSSVPKKSVPPLDEQTQLDIILSDLLNDQVFVSSPTSPKSGATTSSKETRTFRTYDTQTSPDGKTTYQTAEVTYKIPGGYKEERNYTMTKTEESKSYVPTKAFSYTATSPELARKAESPKTHTLPYKTDYDNRYYSESYRTMDSSGSLSPHDHTTTWLEQQQQKLRQRKDSKDEKTVQQERQLVEELKTAQNKYFTKRAANEAEEQATMESYRTTSPPVANGPVSSPGVYNYTVTRTHTYNTERPQDQVNTSWSQGYNTGDSLSSYSSSRADKSKPPPSPGQTRATPPVTAPVTPPVRTSSKDYMQRTRTTSSSSWQGRVGRETDIHPPVIRSISITTPPQSPRPFSPVHVQKVMAPPPPQQQMFGVTSVTPTQSQQTIQTTIRTSSDDVQTRLSPTKTKVTEVQEITHPDGEKKSHYITEVYVHRTPGSTNQSTTLERKERAERETNKLEELEKSLQAASNSIMASAPWQQKGNTQGYSTTEHHVTRKVETRKYETHSQQQHQEQQQRVQKIESNQVQSAPPPPKQISVVEEDRISLRPIGPGMQPLEPEGVGTLGRATTPSFPVSPVASAAGSHGGMVSPSLQQQQHHQQQQQIQHSYQYQTQHQDFQQQQHSGTLQPNITPHGTVRAVTPQDFSHSQQSSRAISPQNGGHSFQESHSYQTSQHHASRSGMDGGLHIDTSPRMLSHGSTSRTPTSPPSPGSLNTLRQQLSVGGTMSPTSHSVTGQSSPSLYFGTSRRGSISSLADSEPAHITTPRFVRDTSKFWYKPHITREEAIVLLKDKQPGSFVVRDSNSYPGAFGLALKVAQIPPNVQTKSTGDPAADLVRHFLVEPTHKGVRLRGSNNEPIFGSLASLVYQHSITPLSLPCKLVLPDAETMASMDSTSSMDGPHKADVPSSAAALLAQGAACNVLYICSVDTESLTGPQAVARAVKVTFDTQPLPKTTVVHFKVSNQGITLTDNQRKLFFRRHYPVAAVTYCGMDPEGRKFKRDTDVPNVQADARVFGFVARKSGGASDNACHLFAELDPEQPASAIVNFVTKIMIGHGKVKS